MAVEHTSGWAIGSFFKYLITKIVIGLKIYWM